MKKFNKTLCIIISVLMLMGVAPIMSSAAENITSLNWMSAIDDDTLITEINIPGTHDSCSCYLDCDVFIQTQDKSLDELLNMGTRFFDMRISNKDGKLICAHNKYNCKINYGNAENLYAKTAVDLMISFLKLNPGETILFALHEEYTSTGSAFYEKFYNECIAPVSEYWYLSNIIPKLSEVRGKIILLNESQSASYTEEQNGVKFPHGSVDSTETINFKKSYIGKNANGDDVNLFYQDSYFIAPTEKKKAIKAFWETDRKSTDLNINYTNCCAAMTPFYTSRIVLPFLESYTFEKGKYYGVMAMDFAKESIVCKYYMSNEPIMTKGLGTSGSASMNHGSNSITQVINKIYPSFLQFFGKLFSFNFG